MADDVKPDATKQYLERLKLAAIYAAALLTFAVANALAARYLGPDAPKIEAPAPVILVTNPDGTVSRAEVHNPSP